MSLVRILPLQGDLLQGGILYIRSATIIKEEFELQELTQKLGCTSGSLPAGVAILRAPRRQTPAQGESPPAGGGRGVLGEVRTADALQDRLGQSILDVQLVRILFHERGQLAQGTGEGGC
jgi:hypothetical protein